jgi:hypothetical protein
MQPLAVVKEVQHQRLLLIAECVQIAEKVLAEKNMPVKLTYRHAILGLYNVIADDDLKKTLFRVSFTRGQIFPFTVGKGEAALYCFNAESVEHNVRSWMQSINLNEILNKKS